MGFVGKSLAMAITNNTDIHVTGYDENGFRARDLNEANLGFWTTHEESEIPASDAYFICVPTPETDGVPNDHPLITAAKVVERSAQPGALVVIESTAPISTMDKELFPIFKRSGLLGAYSPERINPGDTEYDITNTTKILAGMSEEATDTAKKFYGRFVKNVVVSNDHKAVEAAKILENAYRLINISFINQFSDACRESGLDPHEVIRLASTKDFGFQTFYPGAGVGGHCIPVDPVFMQYYFKNNSTGIDILDNAISYNNQRPESLLSQIEKTHGPLAEKKVLVVGMTYKPDVDDVRNAPGQKLYNLLLDKGSDVLWHDGLVKEGSSPLEGTYDFVIVAMKHSSLDLSSITNGTVIDISKGL